MLETITIKTIHEQLDSRRITVNKIVSELTEQTIGDVLGIELLGLGGALNLPVVTLINDTERLSIKKKLTVSLNNELEVVDNVNVVFLRHKKM